MKRVEDATYEAPGWLTGLVALLRGPSIQSCTCEATPRKSTPGNASVLVPYSTHSTRFVKCLSEDERACLSMARTVWLEAGGTLDIYSDAMLARYCEQARPQMCQHARNLTAFAH